MDEATRDDPARILVIDDEEVVHLSLRRILGRQGHHVDADLTAAGGLERLAAEDYDLVVTDLMMPGMSGLELLGHLRAERPELPVVMITGYPTIKTALTALRLGAVDYLAKPFTRQELLGPVRRALRRLVAGRGLTPAVPLPASGGLEPPECKLSTGDRVTLRRHSWAEMGQDGTLKIGIEASFLSGIGVIETVKVPGEAELVEQGYVGIRLRTAGSEEHGVFMPVSGQVVAVNTSAVAAASAIDAATWLLEVIPDATQTDLSLLEHRRAE